MFKNVKVLSFTHFLQGPSAVQMLADLGARRDQDRAAQGRLGAPLGGRRRLY